MKKYLSVILIVFVVGCSGTASKERANGYTPSLKNQADSIMEEVMKAHDAAMSRMGKVSSYKRLADKMIDSLSKNKTSVKLKESLVVIRKNLTEAEDGMEKWMTEFNLDSATVNHQGQVSYLKKEKAKATAIRDVMINAVKQADSIFKK